MRLFTLILTLAMLSGLMEAAERPNILWIVSDDQGCGDLSNAGHPILKTPNLDQLKQRSVSLEHFYVAPLCAPTRAQLLTGRHNFRSGVWDTGNSRSNMASDEVTAAEYLRREGYNTAITGKWHLGENHPFRPIEQGFEESFVFNGLDRFQPTFSKNGQPTPPVDGFLDDVVTTEAIRFMTRKRSRPFFAYVPLYMPHTATYKEAPDELERLFDSVPGLTARDRSLLAMLVHLDRSVGRLLSALRESGQEKNTLVIFHSDNGASSIAASTLRTTGHPSAYNAGLRGWKGEVYEGGIRVPCYISWPGKLAPRTLKARATGYDLLPTLLDLLDLEKTDKPLDGISLWPLLKGAVETLPERFIFQQQQPQKSTQTPQFAVNATVIGPRWKLIYPGETRRAELYDLDADPGEKQDLSAAHPEITASMKAGYEVWFREASQARGFQIQPVTLGHPAQPFFRESMLHIGEEDGLRAVVERAGDYRVTMRKVQAGLYAQGGKLGLTDGTHTWQAEVSKETQEVRFTITLANGPVTLRPTSRGKAPGNHRYRPLGEDPGCREMIIEFLSQP